MKWTGVESELGVFSPSSRQLLAACQLAKPEHCTLNLSSISLRYIWEVWPGKARHQTLGLKIAAAVGWGQNFDWNFFRDQIFGYWIYGKRLKTLLWQSSSATISDSCRVDSTSCFCLLITLALLATTKPELILTQRVVLYNPLPTNCLHYNLGCNCPIRLVCKC